LKHQPRPYRTLKLIAAAVVATSAASVASAQTSLTGSSIGIKSNSSATLASNGYLGTYLVVPSGGATVNFTINATASAGATPSPHMNLVIADSISGFTVGNTSATNYTTSNIALPAGTYFVRDERDYSSNVGVIRSFTVNNLSVSTVSGSAASFSNTNITTSNSNALSAANTYIDNFRKGSASVALTGPGSIPLLAGTPIGVDLARHAFNFGTEVPGNSSTDVNGYLGNNGTSQQINYQAKLNQNFNTIVPGNAGKWSNNEATRDVVTMGNVDTILNYAQSHNMRARMHNLIWGKNSFNGQQPGWVLNNSNNGLLDNAINMSLTQAQRDAAAADLRGEISERIQYYLNSTRAPRIAELDVYNESFHVPQYTTALGYDNVDGIASIHNEAAAAAAAAGATTKMFTNDYNVFEDGGDSYANWYANEIQSIRNAGGNVGGIGAQYYPNSTIGSGNSQHSAGRMQAVFNNLSVQGLPVALTEFGVKAGGEAIATQVLEESMRLTFGTPSATGFLMWGFWSGEGLFASGSPLYDANWNITDNGKKWQDLLGIADWDGNPANGWDTNVSAFVDASGAIQFNGFFGDYYLRGQTTGAYDMTLVKGTSSYSVNLTAPPTWSLWNASNSGAWSSAANWTTGGSASGAGQTAYFGSSVLARTVTVDGNVTVGMLAFNSTVGSYALSGAGTITLQGFGNESGGVAAIYVAAGNHTISAPLALASDTTITVVPSNRTLTVSNLQSSGVTLTKAGLGTLRANNVRAAALIINGGTVQVQPNGASSGVSVINTLFIAAGAGLDLTDNDLAVNNMPFSDVKALVLAGFGNTSGGITSSASDGTQILALFDNALVGATDWQGVAIGPSAIIGKYTFFGDVNFDGQVSGDDYTIVDSNLNTTPPVGMEWLSGDANLDGVVTGDDYTTIDSNLGLGAGNPLLPANVLPEPSFAAIAAGTLLIRLRRSR